MLNRARVCWSIATVLAAALGCGGSSSPGDAQDAGMSGSDLGDGGTAPPAGEVIFETEHAEIITALSQTRDRLLSLDQDKHFHLWDLDKKVSLMHGTTLSSAALGGSRVVAQPLDFEVYDASDGRRVFSIPAADATSAAPAVDGSYVWAASSTALSVFSPTGVKLFSVPGDYSRAAVFAASTEVRIARGGKGANVVERLTVPGGASTTSAPINGTFHAWFADGGYFLTSGSGVANVYTAAGSAKGVFLFPDGNAVGGIGDLVWIYAPGLPYTIKFYPVAGGTTPVASFDLDVTIKVVPTAYGIGILDSGVTSLRVITVTAGMPRMVSLSSPIPEHAGFAMDESGGWSVGARWGNLFYSDAARMKAGQLGLGKPLSLGGSAADGSAKVAVIGFPWKTAVIDLSKSPPSLLTTLDSGGQRVEVSRDGDRIVARSLYAYQYLPADTLRAFAMPAGTLLHEWKFVWGTDPYLHDFTMSAGGSRIAYFTGTRLNNYDWRVDDLSGVNVASGPPSDRGLVLSPNGAEYATRYFEFMNQLTNKPAQLYHEGVLVAGINGDAVGWLDDGRLLVTTYSNSVRITLDKARLYDPGGKLLATLPLTHPIFSFDPLPADRLYVRNTDTIYDLKTGAALWTGLRKDGRLAGDSIVYIEGRQIRRVKY